LLSSAVGEVSTGIDSKHQATAARSILGQCVLCLFAGAESSETTFEIDDEACEILAGQITQLAMGTLKRLGHTRGGGK
jgi:hypothetical protein